MLSASDTASGGWSDGATKMTTRGSGGVACERSPEAPVVEADAGSGEVARGRSTEAPVVEPDAGSGEVARRPSTEAPVVRADADSGEVALEPAAVPDRAVVSVPTPLGVAA